MRQTKQTVEFYASDASDLSLADNVATKADAAAKLVYDAVKAIADASLSATVHAA